MLVDGGKEPSSVENKAFFPGWTVIVVAAQ